MYNNTIPVKENSFRKMTNRILRLFSIMGVIGFASMLFPQMRFFIITFVENVIVHRTLGYRYWDNFLLAGSLAGVFLSAVILAVLYFFAAVTQFLMKHPVASRCLLALPALSAFLLITLLGVNIPHWDEWELVAFFDGIIEHGVKFQDFFAQHNEHRIFFPRIIFFASAFASHFNVKVNMYLSLILLVVVYGCYLVYVKNTIKCKTPSDRLKRQFLGLILGLCCFNVVQHDNLLWGFQVGFVMVAAFSVFCFYFFYRGYIENKFGYFFVSAAAGSIASFSSLHGLFVFPVMIGILFLLFISGEKISLKHVFFIILYMVLTYAIYFYGYSSPLGHQSYFIKSFSGLLLFFFAALGAPFTFRFAAPAIGAGIALFFFGILLTIYLIIKRKTVRYIFPLCLIYFGYAFCGAIAAGRSGMILDAAIASRYTTFALFALIGPIIIVYTEYFVVKEPRKLKYIAVACIQPLLLVLLLQYVFIGDLIDDAHNLRIRQLQLLDYRNQTLDTLRSSYPWTDTDSAYRRIGILEKNRWSFFYHGLSNRKE